MSAQGTAAKAAFKVETGDYKVAATAGAGNLIPAVSDQVGSAPAFRSSDAYSGDGVSIALDRRQNSNTGQVAIEPHYGDIAMLACLLGYSHQDASPVANGDGSYQHFFEPDYDIADRNFDYFDAASPSGTLKRRGTLAVDKNAHIWEWVSLMLSSMQFGFTKDGAAMSFGVLSPSFKLDPATNATSTSWTLPTGSPLEFHDLVIQMKPQNCFIITSSNDAIELTTSVDLTATIEHGVYSGDQLAERVQTGINALAFPSGAGDFLCTWDSGALKFTISNATVTFVVTVDELGSTMGFASGQSSANTQVAGDTASIQGYTAFAASDQIQVSEGTISFAHALKVSSDKSSGTDIAQPYSRGHKANGQFKRPRYISGDEIFLTGINREIEYSVRLSFTGNTIAGSNDEEFIINLPAVKFTSMAASVVGQEVIRQEYGFQAITPEKLDLSNFFDANYFIRDLPAAAGTLYAVTNYNGRLVFAYFSAPNMRLYQLNEDGTYTQLAELTSSQQCLAMAQYEGNLYVGLSGGDIHVWDGSTLSASLTTAKAGNFTDFATYRGKLYAALHEDGDIYQFDGSTWSVARNTTGEVFQLRTYRGNLYAIAEDGGGSPTVQIHKYDGSSWSTLANDLGVQSSGVWGALQVHDGYLYATADTTIERFDDTTWEALTANTYNVRDMVSFQGNLLLFENANPGRISYYDFVNGGDTDLATSQGNLSADQSRPIIYKGRLIWVNKSSSPAYMAMVPDIYVKVQNEISANPL